MPLFVPVQPIPSQTLQVTVGGQASTLNIYQQAYGLYMDVLVGTNAIVQGIIALNGNLIIRNAYFGYLGDFAFYDAQGTTDPVYTGLSTRYFLAYFSASEIAAFNLPAGIE
jgi:hypothetical protein